MNKHIQKLRRLKAIQFWPYFLEHKDELKLILDNDDTIVVASDSENNDEFAEAPCYLGNSEGICDLLFALNIDFDHC